MGSVFNPATLALSGWWRASYAGSPWTPTASAGSSGSNGNLAEALNAPSTGSAVNGLTPASFDGSNDSLTSANPMSTYINAAVYSGWGLVNIPSSSTDSASAWLNDGLFSSLSSQYFGLGFRSSNKVKMYHFDAVDFDGPETGFTFNSWQLLQFRYGGTNLELRVNAGTWASYAKSSINDVTENIIVGRQSASPFMTGSVLELAFSKSALTDTDFDNVRAYASARYGLSL